MLSEGDVLLIVDVQHDFLPGGALAVPNGDEVVPVLAQLARYAEQNGVPIVASRDWHPENHCSFTAQGGPWPPHCIADSEGASLDEDLQLPADVHIVDKATRPDADAYSAFEETGLDTWLRRRDVKRVVIGGLATEYCVLNTARDARTHGFDVTLLTDAIRAIDSSDGERAIDELRDLGADISESSAVLNDSL
jgi:nicotinamidase/pyrazinamidase